MEKNNIHSIAIAEAAVIFEEIASLAHHGDQMCYHFGGDTDLDAMTHQLKFMRDLVERLGLLADIGSDKLGNGMMRGGAEEWILPPSYKWPRKKATEKQQTKMGAQS